MVALDRIQRSNSKVAEVFQDGLVAVFAGATAGIGETSLREFARHASKPRIYVLGRSKEACDRLDAELKTINPGGTYILYVYQFPSLTGDGRAAWAVSHCGRLLTTLVNRI